MSKTLLSNIEDTRENIRENIKFIKVGLFLPPEKLKININQRTSAKTVGMIREATTLHKNGLSWKKMQEFGLEYRFLALYLQKKITRPEMIEKINSETYKYAKRQMTWFKKDPEIQWFDASAKNLEKKVLDIFTNCL